MIPVYQTLVLQKHSRGNCFNACVASILQKPLKDIPDILPGQKGSWIGRWKVYLATINLKLIKHTKDNPPEGYSIVVGTLPHMYPENHDKSGSSIVHACVTFDGKIVHDPFPLGSPGFSPLHFYTLEELNEKEIECHKKNSVEGFCDHGYLSKCHRCQK